LAFQPDLAIVRSISYSGPDVRIAGVYMIRSTLIEDFIGHIQINNYGNTVFPDTHIPITRQLDTLGFSTHTPAATPMQSIAEKVGDGDWVISIDFIKN
jgi:hypothetical protein